MANRRHRRRRHVEEEELMLTSLMDILATLLFFLLSTLVLVNIGQIDAPIPKVVDPAQAPPSPEKVPFNLKVTITATGLIVESNALPGGQKVIPNSDSGDFGINTLHDLMISIKSRFMDQRAVTIRPEESVIYQTIVNVMDATREITDKDPDLPGRPRPKGEEVPASHWELFPDVIMEGVF